MEGAMRTEYGNFQLTNQNVIFDGGDDEGCSVYLFKCRELEKAARDRALSDYVSVYLTCIAEEFEIDYCLEGDEVLHTLGYPELGRQEILFLQQCKDF